MMTTSMSPAGALSPAGASPSKALSATESRALSPTEMSPTETRIVLRDIDWDVYQSLAAGSERAGRRIVFDRGEMEIMSPSWTHEIDKALINRMVERFAEARNLDVLSSASTTFKRSDLDRGFEPDASFYIQNEPTVRSKGEIDLAVDPPLDLVIEIERSRSAIRKLPLLAEFGVPEVWRYDGQDLTVYRLTSSGYQSADRSGCLPAFPVQVAGEILRAIGSVSETELIRRFVSGL